MIYKLTTIENAQSSEVTRLGNSGTVLVDFGLSHQLLDRDLEFVQKVEHKGIDQGGLEPRHIENSHKRRNGYTPGSDGNSAGTFWRECI
jgi:hypothetical protein